MYTAKPTYLDDMVGQESIKNRARMALGAAQQRDEPFPHTMLMSSGGGLGKTTCAGILANEMHVGLVSASGPAIRDAVDLRRVLIEVESRWILHIDEIHAMGRKAMEELLLVLEEGVINVNCEGAPVRYNLPPFTLIGSTTQPSKLPEPLRQRFGLQFHFDFYDVGELTEIARRFAGRWTVAFDDDVCRAIADRSLGVPRICRRLCERVRDVANACRAPRATMAEFVRAMDLEGIDSLGLNLQHRSYLAQLRKAIPRPVSAASMSKALGIEQATVTEVIEPPLIRLGLVTIGPGGRRITQNGLTHLQAVATNAHSASIVHAKSAHPTDDSGGTIWHPSMN